MLLPTPFNIEICIALEKNTKRCITVNEFLIKAKVFEVENNNKANIFLKLF